MTAFSLLAALRSNPMLLLLTIAVASTAAVATIPALVRPRAFSVVALASAAVYFGSAFPGFVLVIVTAYILIRTTAAAGRRTVQWQCALVAILALSLVFVAGRVGGWSDHRVRVGSSALVFYILDMWLVLRLVTLLWEVGSGSRKAPDPVEYVGWVAFPLTLGGPLVRYSEWPPTLAPVPSVLGRLAWWRGVGEGAVKMAAAAALPLLPGMLPPHWSSAPLLRGLLLVFLVGPVGFYLMLAGYFQIIEQLGSVIGVRVPESFNRPIGRENVSAFWANWNMTATRVFRDYVYYSRWGLRGYYPYLNAMVLFTMVGLWHDVRPYWILWGVLHGLLFCAYLVWKRWSPWLPALPLRGTLPARVGSRALTFAGVCACWYLPGKILAAFGLP